MAQIGNCPFGFEDGHIKGYEAAFECLHVTVEFWNEKQGALTFLQPLAVRDNASIGVTLGSVKQNHSSELIMEVVAHQYGKPPETIDLSHYQFLDLDDFPILEIVAKSCSFLALGE